MKKTRGKKKSARTSWPFNKTLATRRSGKLMLLLVRLPELQKDIAALRANFGIPRSGYHYDGADGLPEKRVQEMREKVRAAVDKKVGAIGGYFMPPRTDAEVIAQRLDTESLKGWICRIGEKFSLPYNLYHSAFWGVCHYALWNEILVPPRNWELLNDPRDDGRPLKTRWVSIRAYAPLDENESKEAVIALNRALRENFPKGLAKKRRVRRTDERKLDEIAELLAEHASGRRYPLSWGSRKMLEQANKLAKELFGYPLYPPRRKKMRR